MILVSRGSIAWEPQRKHPLLNLRLTAVQHGHRSLQLGAQAATLERKRSRWSDTGQLGAQAVTAATVPPDNLPKGLLAPKNKDVPNGNNESHLARHSIRRIRSTW